LFGNYAFSWNLGLLELLSDSGHWPVHLFVQFPWPYDIDVAVSKVFFHGSLSRSKLQGSARGKAWRTTSADRSVQSCQPFASLRRKTRRSVQQVAVNGNGNGNSHKTKSIRETNIEQRNKKGQEAHLLLW